MQWTMEPPDCTRLSCRLYNSILSFAHAYSESILYASKLVVTVVYGVVYTHPPKTPDWPVTYTQHTIRRQLTPLE